MSRAKPNQNDLRRSIGYNMITFMSVFIFLSDHLVYSSVFQRSGFILALGHKLGSPCPNQCRLLLLGISKGLAEEFVRSHWN